MEFISGARGWLHSRILFACVVDAVVNAVRAPFSVHAVNVLGTYRSVRCCPTLCDRRISFRAQDTKPTCTGRDIIASRREYADDSAGNSSFSVSRQGTLFTDGVSLLLIVL